LFFLDWGSRLCVAFHPSPFVVAPDVISQREEASLSMPKGGKRINFSSVNA
jgi:hypothetical protein